LLSIKIPAFVGKTIITFKIIECFPDLSNNRLGKNARACSELGVLQMLESPRISNNEIYNSSNQRIKYQICWFQKEKIKGSVA